MAAKSNPITRRTMIVTAAATTAAALYEALPGCHGPRPGKPPPRLPLADVTFQDITRSSGIQFKHVNGAFGQKWLPETMGSGLAWIDYDGDGYQDLFVVNSREWTRDERESGHQPPGPAATSTCKLYRNNGNGTFTDVTQTARLDVPMYGMGVCVGDFDNDGHPDILVTSLTRNYLFRNNGNGTFTDVTDHAGVRGSGWSTSAAFVDYDRDGCLDLIVCHYVKWTPATNIQLWQNRHPTYTTPQKYVGLPPTLYRNNGNGTFTDVSKMAGIQGQSLKGKSLGVAILDYDNDGWPDIAIANDTEPNYLYHNLGNGSFQEVGRELNIAYPDRGDARGAMGIDTSDYDRSGYESMAIGNFSNQQIAMYHNDGGQVFRDVASQNGVGPASLLSLSFGLFFFDMDNDGWEDMFVANGHVDDDVEESQKRIFYAESPLIFRNLGNGTFADVSGSAGPDIMQRLVARGAAYADFDLDGFPDIAISTNNGPLHLYRNSGCTNHALRLELNGVLSNRSAIGSVVSVKSAGKSQTYQVHSGSSYCSQSELPITVGLGAATSAESITITWPHESSKKEELRNLAAGSIYTVVEGKGIVRTRPLNRTTRSSP